MFELVFILFIVSLLVTTFVRSAWLIGLISFAGLILLGVALISVLSSDKRDLTPFWLLVGAWSWGIAVASLLKFLWAGSAQVSAQSTYSITWIYWLMSAFWMAWGAASIGYAFGSNIAITYSENMEASLILYDRSMAGAASGFFYLSLAAGNATTALFKTALTRKGVRVGAALIRWKEIDSYEWQGNKLILHRKTKVFGRRSSDIWFVINPAHQDTTNHLLAQHLPDEPGHSPHPLQAAA